MFVGSPIESEEKELVKLAKRLKKEKVNVDVVSFGEEVRPVVRKQTLTPHKDCEFIIVILITELSTLLFHSGAGDDRQPIYSCS